MHGVFDHFRLCRILWLLHLQDITRIIFGLLVFLILFVYKFKNSNALTQSAKAALADVEEEFEQHRRRALEREQKISRKLQDEINKKKGA